MATTRPASRGVRASNGLLIIIVLAVGTMAGAASFRHVHDWTMHNSPTNTPGWFGWANAVITELIPTAALIIIAQRRKNGGHIGYPMFLLIAAVSLSLTAQLAVALPTVFGWMVSALPSLAFFALSKLVFSATSHAPDTAPAPPAVPAAVNPVGELPARTVLETAPTLKVAALRPDPPARAPSHDTATGTASPTAATTTPARPEPTRTPTTGSLTVPTTTRPQPTRIAPATVEHAAGTDASASATASMLPSARMYVESHHQAHGTAITPGQLAVRMRIDTPTADRLLRALNSTTDVFTDTPAITHTHNGTRPRTDVSA
jgi:hypothetical protein